MEISGVRNWKDIFSNDAHFSALLQIKRLNEDPNFHGIIVQMPLESDNSIDSHLITDAVSPDKDVDG